MYISMLANANYLIVKLDFCLFLRDTLVFLIPIILLVSQEYRTF